MKRAREFFTSPIVITVAALVLRLAYLLVGIATRRSIPNGHLIIAHETGRIAIHIAEGHGFSSPLKFDTGPTAWLTPIYPYLLAMVFKIFGIATVHSEVAIKVLNNIFSALVCLPLFAVGKRLFGKSVGAAAAWLWVLYYPAFFWATSWIWDTSLTALALALILWATYALDDNVGTARWAGYGGLWAFGTMVNPAVLSTLPGLFAYAAYRAHKRGAAWVQLTAIAAVVFAAGITPWIIRNQIVFHGQVLLRSNFGLELWLGNNPEVPDTWTWWLHPNDNDREGLKFARMGEVAYMREKERLAVEFIKTHPVDVARFEFHRFIENWTGTDDPIVDAWSRIPLWAKTQLAFNCLFSLLAWAGLISARRAEPIRYLPLGVIFLFFPLVYYITHNTPRYRHPMEPAMALMVVYAIAYPLRVLNEKRHRARVSAVSEQVVA